MVDLLIRYTGDGAGTYDDGRAGSERWQREQAVFGEMFATVCPESVVDCPFGTGRWLPFYRDVPGNVTGVDLSADMLAQARTKGAGALANLRTVQASIFDHDFGLYAGVDLMVCVRFLNWVTKVDARLALQSLARAEAEWWIVGVSVRPADNNVLRDARMHAASLAVRARSWKNRQPFQYVHDETELLGWFDELGLSVERREFIFGNPSRDNFFYLLRRKADVSTPVSERA